MPKFARKKSLGVFERFIRIQWRPYQVRVAKRPSPLDSDEPAGHTSQYGRRSPLARIGDVPIRLAMRAPLRTRYRAVALKTKGASMPHFGSSLEIDITLITNPIVSSASINSPKRGRAFIPILQIDGETHFLVNARLFVA
jgi:hypothetical protein